LEIEPGTIIANRYRVMRPLGRGGMGEVFAAENTRTGRSVAIKVLHADAKAKKSAVERFRREARAAGSINSDHVTQVLDVEDDPQFGIVLVFELLEGESLVERLKRTGPIPFEELHGIIEQVWIGLADAHRAGIIHRDLKPSNVFLEHRPDGKTRVKILDFGISKLPKKMEGETLTEMGQSLGTFSFMPPEQIGKAKTVDHRADIYATTTMIYQALTGQLPYLARNVLIMVEMKNKAEPRRISDAMDGHVDPRLEAFVARGLARDADMRFQSALDALAAWRELRPRASAQDFDAAPIAAPISSNPSPPATPVPSARPPVSGPRGTVAMEILQEQRRAEPVPKLVVEPTSDDSAATVAIPAARLLSSAGAAGAWPPPSTPQAKMPHAMPGAQQQAPVGVPYGGYPGATGSGSYGAVQPPSAQVPAQPMYTPPVQGAPGYPADPGAGNTLDKTQLYTPPQGNPMAMPAPAVSSMALPAPQLPQQQPAPPRQRTWLTFVMIAVMLGLVGFAVVAVAMLMK
jgi:serine/threonine-protein kinase